MRLQKLVDLGKRQITNTELLTRYIFGSQNPTPFKPGEYYEAGSYVYQVSPTGKIEVYYCTTSGIYDTITTAGWTEGSIPSIVQQSITRNQVLLNIEDQDVNETFTSLSSDISSDIFEKVIYYPKDCSITNNIVTLPIDEFYHMDVIYNGKKLSEVANDIDVDGNVITVNVVGKVMATMNIYFEVYIAKNTNAQLIKFVDKCPDYVKFGATAIGTTPVVVPDHSIVMGIDRDMVAKSTVFDLFYKGYYISDNDYTLIYDNANNVIIFTIDSNCVERLGINVDAINQFVITCTTTISSQVIITKQDAIIPVTTDETTSMIDLHDVTYNYRSILNKSYVNVSRIAPKNIEYFKLSVILKNKKSFIASSRNYILSSKTIGYIPSATALDKCNDYIPVDKSMGSSVGIPFPDFDPNKTSIMIFNEEGNYIADNRYYADYDGRVYFYDTTLARTGLLNFVKIADDIGIYKYYDMITITPDMVRNGVSIPFLDYKYEYGPLFVFTSSGSYINIDKYTVSNNRIIFNEGVIKENDIIEVFYLEFIGLTTNTVMKIEVVTPSSGTELQIPFKTYDPTTDTIMLLSSTGVFIGKTRYTISDTGLVTITSGSQFDPSTETVDVVIVRTSESPNYIENVPMVMDRL